MILPKGLSTFLNHTLLRFLLVIDIFLLGQDILEDSQCSVSVTDGETMFRVSPLIFTVHYQERFSAAGQTSGGFFKREGRAKDHEVLICRSIDRPLRPTMMKGFYHETQVLSWVLSYGGLHSPDSLVITASGIAVALSEVPHSKTIAGVQIGLVGDKYIVNPTTKEMEESELDLVLAGTDTAILIIEGFCNFLPEEKVPKAVEIGQDAVRVICNEVEALVKKCGKPKWLKQLKCLLKSYIDMLKYGVTTPFIYFVLVLMKRHVISA